MTEPGARASASASRVDIASVEDGLLMQVPSRRDALEPAQQGLSSFLSGRGVTGKALFACELVLEELLANLISHAFDDAQEHRIEVQVQLAAGEIHLQVSDDGRAFDATAQADPVLPTTLDEARPGGLGLLLVRRWAQGLAYRRDGGRNRLSVSIARPDCAVDPAAGSTRSP